MKYSGEKKWQSYSYAQIMVIHVCFDFTDFLKFISISIYLFIYFADWSHMTEIVILSRMPSHYLPQLLWAGPIQGSNNYIPRIKRTCPKFTNQLSRDISFISRHVMVMGRKTLKPLRRETDYYKQGKIKPLSLLIFFAFLCHDYQWVQVYHTPQFNLPF